MEINEITSISLFQDMQSTVTADLQSKMHPGEIQMKAYTLNQ